MFGLEPENILSLSGIALYAAIFLLPFFQEDVAVIAAATASLTGAGDSAILFATIIFGLSASDIWKYWLGWFARHRSWAHRFAEKPGVSTAGRLVRDELYKTLVTARFVPGTRIPTYLACGFFDIPYLRFVIFVVSTAVLYVIVMFGIFHAIGEVAGERAHVYLPVIAITLAGAYIFFRVHRARRNGDKP